MVCFIICHFRTTYYSQTQQSCSNCSIPPQKIPQYYSYCLFISVLQGIKISFPRILTWIMLYWIYTSLQKAAWTWQDSVPSLVSIFQKCIFLRKYPNTDSYRSVKPFEEETLQSLSDFQNLRILSLANFGCKQIKFAMTKSFTEKTTKNPYFKSKAQGISMFKKLIMWDNCWGQFWEMICRSFTGEGLNSCWSLNNDKIATSRWNIVIFSLNDDNYLFPSNLNKNRNNILLFKT